jgi:hypothetical protein
MSNIQDIDTNANLLRAILWQYEGAPKLRQIVDAEQAYFDGAQVQFWSDWLRDVFDFNTANDFGLAVWARILDINLGVDAPASGDEAKFGFGTNNENFGAGNFGRAKAGDIGLTTAQKRLVIRLRYAQITKRPTLSNINETLSTVFADFGGVAYAVDNRDMTIEYLFAFTLPSSLKLVLEQYDLLLRPAGVAYTVSETVPMVLNELAIVLE